MKGDYWRSRNPKWLKLVVKEGFIFIVTVTDGVMQRRLIEMITMDLVMCHQNYFLLLKKKHTFKYLEFFFEFMWALLCVYVDTCLLCSRLLSSSIKNSFILTLSCIKKLYFPERCINVTTDVLLPL